ncbi:uncharacterized protein [Amphiura filiformis]|uniref:uncharacterized protein n=1 Tax=Amphiura filiformis TaxID=82378 RepID=UPI003B228A64
MTPKTRAFDIRLQRIQNSLTGGMCALMRSIGDDKLTSELEEVVALLCNANYELSNARKDHIKPQLNPAYGHLCQTQTGSDFLFGDDLQRFREESKVPPLFYARRAPIQLSSEKGTVSPWTFFREQITPDAGTLPPATAVPSGISATAVAPDIASPETVQQRESTLYPNQTKPVVKPAEIVRRSLQEQGVPQEALLIIEQSWRPSTAKQYHVYITRWLDFCSRWGTNPMQSDVGPVLSFLTEQFSNFNLSYSAMNTCRCALSTFLIIPGAHTVGTHPLITRFIKGVFQIRPTLPRYSEVWDVTIVLNYLKSLHPTNQLRLRDLTFKLTMLMALTTGQRVQTLHMLNLEDMVVHSNDITFYCSKLLKQSRPGNVGMKIEFKSYNVDKRVCVLSVLQHYIKVTKSLRGDEQQLLISFRKPHGKVTKDTISGWIKRTMKAAGVNIEVFKSHSTRAASCSAANSRHVPITDILAAAGWSGEKTFQQHYNKPVVKQSEFANAVLE